jgi:hypothetical protein
MRSIVLIACLAVLALAACAGVSGSNTALYDSLDERDVTLAAALVERRERAPRLDYLDAHLSRANGRFCRDYREEVAVGNDVGRFDHSACRDDAERWVWL